MESTVVLQQGDKVAVQFEKRKEMIGISGSGHVHVDQVNSGYHFNVNDHALEHPTTSAQEATETGEYTGPSLSTRGLLNPAGYRPPEPTRAENIGHYLYLLYEAQKSGHEVHKEIDDALAQYKKEIGI